MSIRFWRSFGVAVLAACITSIVAFAKGSYSFITIAGADLTETVRTSEPALTEDFFAFADFHRDRVEAPANPGVGYEITRYYIDGRREIAFDRLHYYPAAGFVFYDGIINGSSEYDKKWYAAKAEIRSVFENALPAVPIAESQAVNTEKDTTYAANNSNQLSMETDRTPFLAPIAVAMAILMAVLILFSRRKIFSRYLEEAIMVSRFSRSFAVALLLSLLFVVQASAGGWAVITLDELPSNVVAAEPLHIGFMVRQHGRTPMTGLSPTVTASLDQQTDFVVNAEAQGEPGHYVATLNFPKEGEWRWSIQAFTMDQSMPVLSVAPAAGGANEATSPTVTSTESALPAIPAMTLAAITALSIGLISAVIAFRSRNRQAAGLTAVSLLAGIALFIAGTGRASAVEAQADAVSSSVDVSSISQVEYGRQLFIAKGCITCHHNSKAANSSEYWTIDNGAPDLSNFSANPEVITMRLKDPSSVKSDTQMPNLELQEFEIESLVAFINSR